MGKYIAIVGLLFSAYSLSGQYYDTSVGLRAGTGLNVSAKKFLTESTAAEGIVGLYGFGRYNGLGLTALYQIHNPINTAEHQLEWYYGGGGSLVLVESATNLGIAGNLGIEYVFQDLPINFALDTLPTLFFGADNRFDISFSAAIRYILQ